MIFDPLSPGLGTFVTLLPIAHPFSTAAVFVAITQRFTDASAEN